MYLRQLTLIYVLLLLVEPYDVTLIRYRYKRYGYCFVSVSFYKISKLYCLGQLFMFSITLVHCTGSALPIHEVLLLNYYFAFRAGPFNIGGLNHRDNCRDTHLMLYGVSVNIGFTSL